MHNNIQIFDYIYKYRIIYNISDYLSLWIVCFTNNLIIHKHMHKSNSFTIYISVMHVWFKFYVFMYRSFRIITYHIRIINIFVNYLIGVKSRNKSIQVTCINILQYIFIIKVMVHMLVTAGYISIYYPGGLLATLFNNLNVSLVYD